MNEGKVEAFIERIYDFVFIEDRIVTCVWLSDVLNIHANTAKQLLHAFVKKYGEKDKLLVTYFIGGILKDGRGIKLKLVKYDEREEEKNQFSVLSTDHIYSIQKSPGVVNSLDIFNSFSAIKLSSDKRKFCPLKPCKELEKRDVKQTVFETKKETSKPTSQPPIKNDTVKQKATSNDVHEPPKKQPKTSPEKNKTKAKGGIADMFNKQNEKMKSEAPASKTVKKVEVMKAVGIGGYFQKQPPKKQESSEPMEVDNSPPIKETQSTVKEKNKIKMNEGKDESSESLIKEKKSKGKENRKKRKKRDEKEDESHRKRKRIAVVFSSDSDSSDNEVSEHEMEPEPPPTHEVSPMREEEDIIPPTPTPGRKRVRKQIDKTFTDEDGYILTKKEYVYESCTDEEEMEEKKIEPKETKSDEHKLGPNDSTKPNKKDENKKPTKKSPVKKKTSNGNPNAKQPSIMNFFKKK